VGHCSSVKREQREKTFLLSFRFVGRARWVSCAPLFSLPFLNPTRWASNSCSWFVFHCGRPCGQLRKKPGSGSLGDLCWICAGSEAAVYSRLRRCAVGLRRFPLPRPWTLLPASEQVWCSHPPALHSLYYGVASSAYLADVLLVCSFFYFLFSDLGAFALWPCCCVLIYQFILVSMLLIRAEEIDVCCWRVVPCVRGL
jgi:hypothetical protein